MLKSKNVLDLKYVRRPGQQWQLLEDGTVELAMEHKGFFAAIAQKFFRRPSVSYIKLDELGSFVWLELANSNEVMTVAKAVQERFGEKAEPLLPRLAGFLTCWSVTASLLGKNNPTKNLALLPSLGVGLFVILLV